MLFLISTFKFSNSTLVDTRVSAFIHATWYKFSRDERLGVHHVVALAKIRDQEDIATIDNVVTKKLLEVGAIREVKNSYLLSESFTELIREIEGSDRNKVIEFINETGEAKMGDLVSLFDNRLTRRQVNNLVYNLVDENVLKRKGKGAATTYLINV